MPMNIVEQQIADTYPALIRIQEKKGPAPVSITIVKNHYPDFKILFPEKGAGLWVEVKGHIRDRDYLLMLRNFPESLKKFYRVLLVHKNKREAEKIGKTLDKIGIKYAKFDIPNQWFIDAAELYREATCNTKLTLKQDAGTGQVPLTPKDTVGMETVTRHTEWRMK